jgi:hypothetical protein
MDAANQWPARRRVAAAASRARLTSASAPGSGTDVAWKLPMVVMPSPNSLSVEKPRKPKV